MVVDCEVSKWSNCSETCGTGYRNRSMLIETKHGGQPCETLSETCNPQPCPGKYFLMKMVFKAKITLETNFTR